MKRIRFTLHAAGKFQTLAEHGLTISELDVAGVIRSPALVHPGAHLRQIAQGALDDEHVLRVIYEETESEIIVVTFYPGRKERYESDV